jgi:SSS family solute:Na+ symporter
MISIILLSLFLILMVAIGVWGLRKTNSLNDFFLGGRNVGPWISAFAYGTTYFSAVAFIGFAGRFGWDFGINSLWIGISNALFGSLLAWLVLGRRTRTMSQNLEAMTMPEFLQDRYDAKHLKMITAIIIFVFLVPYSASVFKGLGHIFEKNFGISYDLALLIMIGITGVYLVLGGYFAITMTDFIQGLIIIVGSILTVGVFLGKGGGIVETLSSINRGFQSNVGGKFDPIILISTVFMTSFGVWGLPQMVQKFYAIKNEKVIPRAAIATFIFALIISGSAYFIGSMSHIFFNAGNRPSIDEIVPTILSGNLPEILMAIILLLIVSASMSTLSSLVLVSSSSVAIDLYKGHVNPNMSKENSLFMMRFLSAIFVILSYFVARFQIGFIVTLMSLSWGAVAGSFMAPYIYGLYWKKTTKIGAGAGMFTGLVTAISLFFILGPKMSPVASSIAMILPFIVVPVVSLFTTPPKKEIIDKAFRNI